MVRALGLLPLAVAIGVLAPPNGLAQTRAERIDAVAKGAFESGAFHGALLVAEGEDVIYRGAFGMADLDRGIANTPATLNPIHSITKVFTAILVLQLMEAGKLDDSGTLNEHLPSVSFESADRITLHHLLSHTSGIPDYLFALPGYLTPNPPTHPRDQVLSEVAAMPLEYPPGEGFGYSNTGYVLLGMVIERATGKSYETVLEERILRPLGMKDSRWMATEVGPAIARQYRRGDGGEAAPVLVFPGEGGIVSTLDDMHRFALAIGSTTLLSEASWNLAFTPHGLPENASRSHPAHRFPYGYGFAISELPFATGRSARAVLHGGQGYGGNAMLIRFLDRDRVIFLWNNKGGTNPFLPGLIEALASEGG